MNFKRIMAVAAGLLLAVFMASAQKSAKVTASLADSSNDDPVGFATVSLQKINSDKPYKYVLSSSEGKAVISESTCSRLRSWATKPSARKSR